MKLLAEPDDVFMAVEQVTGIGRDLLQGDARIRPIADARKIAFMAMRLCCGMKGRHIRLLIGGNQTVMERQARNLADTDGKFSKDLYDTLAALEDMKDEYLAG